MKTVVPVKVDPVAVEQGVLPPTSPIDAYGETGEIRHLLSDVKFVAALETAARILADRYTKKDARARMQLNKSILTMYANYDNKFNGLINDNSVWMDYADMGNNFGFSVPLFKAHVDTALTFYCKTRPRYKINSTINRYKYNRLAQMCNTIGTRELDRMMTYTKVQTEGQYALLAGRSSRKLVKRVDDGARMHSKESTTSRKKIGDNALCENCGNDFFVPEFIEQVSCPRCFSVRVNPVSEEFESEKIRIKYRNPRVQIEIPNPVLLQSDFKAGESSFRIERSTIERYKAEFKYQRKFDGAGNVAAEADATDRLGREPTVAGNDLYNMTNQSVLADVLTNVFNEVNDQLPVVRMWLEPSEYGMIKIKGHYCAEYFPDGVYLKLVNGSLVEVDAFRPKQHWVDVVAGRRPASNHGSGLMHLADLNDLINNAVNLEYSVLRTSGFPVTVIREKYMSGIMPEASGTIVLGKAVPDDISNEQAVSRLPAANASGMLGVMSQRFEQYMQQVGATWSFAAATGDIRQLMGTATGAAALQEMMTDRLGLILQMRIEADIQTIYNILTLMQGDRTPEMEQELREEFDSEIVEMFFESDLTSLLAIEAEKGSDTPMLESLNVYKMQTFAQLTASLTGLREFDESSFYDLVGAIGDSLNLPVEIGSGRKERHYANVQISKIESQYQDIAQSEEAAQMRPDEIALALFSSIKQEEMMYMNVVPEVEATLFDHKSLSEVYSDWIQSNAGISAPIPVKMVIVMLFGYHQQVIEARQAAEMEQQMRMQERMAAMASKGGAPAGNSNAAKPEDEERQPKRDGTFGVGRPRDVDSAEEVADTMGQDPAEAGAMPM